VILGLLFWSGNALNLIPMLWSVGIGQAFSSGGSLPLAGGALLLGLLVIVVGMTQSSLLIGSFHWVIQVVHLLLDIVAVAIGQIAAARWRNSSAIREEQPIRAA
jgi:hypothetical protein